jgi:hypothetical protein
MDSLGAAGFFLVVSGALIATTGNPSTEGCAALVASPRSTFVGEVVAKDGAAATYGVDELLRDETNPADDNPFQLGRGQLVVVRYHGGDQRFIHHGQSYRVVAYGSADDLGSSVHTAGECDGGSGTGTRHADGSVIDTGLLTRDGIAPYLPWLAGGALAIAMVAVLVRWRIRRKHPLLTISGQPLP